MSTKSGISRRRFLQSSATAMAGLAAPALGSGAKVFGRAPYFRKNSAVRKVLALGMDGLDPDLLKRFVAEGEMPTFKKLIEQGYLSNLRTTLPAQSPVAWASFTAGTNPGGTGIFDFIHRDPKTMIPHLSISRSFPGKRNISIGKWKIPVDSGRVELMRHGAAFWEILEENGVPSSVFQIPSNFPADGGTARTMSGMGTPDLLGGYGTTTFITDTDIPGASEMDGTTIARVRVIDHKVKTKILGPRNSLRDKDPDSEIEVAIYRDPIEPTLKIEVGGQSVVLRQGEWSDWVPLSFELMPMFASVGGMVRFYAKEVHPRLKIYVSPVNIDPMDPALPICSPAGYSRELTQAVGRFYTQGLPADTKGLSMGLLDDDEYLAQANLVLGENFRMLDHQLASFDDGFMFFYFSSIDQNCHMLMRAMDPTHPQYNPNASPDVKNAIRHFYKRMDEALRMALEKVDANTWLMVLSDHGFGTFRREVHLNTWLMENGYVTLKEPLGDDPGDIFSLVDWSKTRAYGLGFNGLYLNMQDREPNGIVSPSEAPALKAEIMTKLSTLTDPLQGNSVVSRMFDSAEAYHGPFTALAPDMLVGYQRGYRVSDHSVLGKFPQGVVGDRTNKWSSDHCFNPGLVPGVLVSNRKLSVDDPAIWDLGPTVLAAFGVAPTPGMDGRNIVAW